MNTKNQPLNADSEKSKQTSIPSTENVIPSAALTNTTLPKETPAEEKLTGTQKPRRNPTNIQRSKVTSLAEITDEVLLELIPGHITSNVSRNSPRIVEAKNLIRDSFTAENKSPFIKKMQGLRILRPAWIEIEQWESEIDISPEERQIAFMASWGMKDSEIAEELGYTYDRVRNVLGTKRAKDKVEEIQSKVLKVNPKKWMEKLLPDALAVSHKIMMDEAVKPGVRLQAAFDIMDRVMGKAKQTVEVQDSTYRDLLQKLEEIAKKEQNTIEVGEAKTWESKEQENLDPIDKWAMKNL